MMAIFPIIECDDVVQVNDKFRIDASKSYISKGESAVTLVEIEPDAGSGFIQVQGSPIANKNFYLDWQYSSSGAKVVSVRITTNGSPVTVTKSVSVLTEAEDKLFSNDQDLEAVENKILKYVPDGKSSFKYMHRRAQKEMIAHLNKGGWFKYNGLPITKDDFIDTEQVRYWSTYLTLKLIFKDISNQPGDVFEVKSKNYENMEHSWREMAILKLDLDGDGEQSSVEGFNLTSRDLVRS